MKRFPLLALAVLAVGCASVPMAPPELDAAAKQFKGTPGKATIYVFRDEAIGAAIKMPVIIDGRMLGDTASKTFLLTAVDPGKHTLISKAENDSVLDITAAADTNVFIWQEVKMGVLMARSKLQLVPEAEGKGRVQNCGLATGMLPLPVAPAAPAPAPAAPVPGA